MKTLSRFVTKFTGLVVAVLSCFDRVIFKGHLPISNGPALEGFLDHVLKIRRCDFMAFAERQSEALVDGARRAAEEAGVEYRFLKGSHRKDKLVDEVLRQRSDLVEGLVAVFCGMECCPSFRLVYGQGRPRLVAARRQRRRAGRRVRRRARLAGDAGQRRWRRSGRRRAGQVRRRLSRLSADPLRLRHGREAVNENTPMGNGECGISPPC